MCGRYALFQPTQGVQLQFQFEFADPAATNLAPNYNVAPTANVPIVVEHYGRPVGEPRGGVVPEPQGAVRELLLSRWGLVPGWARAGGNGPVLFNARLETAAEKPSFAESMAKRRCIFPMNGYFEWQTRQGDKQPFYISVPTTPLRGKAEENGAVPKLGGAAETAELVRKYGTETAEKVGEPGTETAEKVQERGSGATPELLGMAGLYSWWRKPGGAWLLSATILTRPAQENLRHIHHREPVALRSEEYAVWLDPNLQDGAAARELLRRPAPLLEAVAVRQEVNNVRNNSPENVRPLHD
ncbi:UPF0361 protein yoqW [Actinobaculum suis]|uniref:Abasic site processing protein n=1 Tax=Actinobaculum suis TaxID=1657 RepID=A0A7Z8Y9S9_9ACTO|nr:SOS response-associated peptidase [Actinobaculum suis]VDG76954.1 UPF0361 protein yoqW [Actinobaculum suis]